MDGLFTPAVEPRLRPRYERLVREPLHVADPLASGLCALPGLSDGLARVQAAWRFYAKERITPPVRIGLQVFLAMMEALDHNRLDDLRELRRFFLGHENSG